MTEIETLLAQSQAADDFKDAVRRYCSGDRAEHIHIEGSAPSVKVRRVLAHMLAMEAHLPIQRVSVRGRSGCSDFIGTLKVETTSDVHEFEFIWDCRWRAEQEGWTDYFGFPDQARAAREYDWQCFQVWQLSSSLSS